MMKGYIRIVKRFKTDKIAREYKKKHYPNAGARLQPFKNYWVLDINKY